MTETGQLEGIEGMEVIYRGQLERIDRMIKEENETGIKFPHLNRDIQALAALSKSISKAREWELAHGDVDPVKRRRLERQNQILQRNWSVFMDRLGDDGQDRMIKFLNRLLEELPKIRTRIEKLSDGTLKFTGPDGTCRLVKPEKDAT